MRYVAMGVDEISEGEREVNEFNNLPRSCNGQMGLPLNWGCVSG